jgi:acylphosphatase
MGYNLGSMGDRVVRLRITGLVQGVGFRAFVENEASRRTLRGWVRNRREDRSVEAVIAGPGEDVGEMIVVCRHGPPGAQVHNVEVLEAEAADLAERRPWAEFSVLPSA